MALLRIILWSPLLLSCSGLSAVRNSLLHARVFAHQSRLSASSTTSQAFTTSEESNEVNAWSRHSFSDEEFGKNNESLPLPSSRRRALTTLPLAALLLSPKTPCANAAETTAESIRVAAASIPGLGPPDVYYPPYFAGRWRVARVITNSDDALFRGVNLPLTIVHEMRFVPYDSGAASASNAANSGDDVSNSNAPAIADRAFNERSYYSALSSELARFSTAIVPESSSSKVKSISPIQSLDWTATNPNVISVSYGDGSSREVKVTKRSSDISKDGSTVFSSEFRRITTVPSMGDGAKSLEAGGKAKLVGGAGIPAISGSRVLTKWKRDGTTQEGADLIEGIEILYNEQGTLGERDSMSTGGISSLYGGDSKDLANWRSTKTKILMERIL